MRVEGRADVQRKLLALAQTARGKILRDALREGAEPMRARASSLARRAAGAPDLADHIVISGARTENDAGVAVGPSNQERSDQPGRTFADQGRFLEYGTKKMQAFPFMRPAFDSEGEPVAQHVVDRIWQKLAELLR